MLERHDLRHPDGRQFHLYGPFDGELAGAAAALDVGAIHLRRDLLTDSWVVVSPARNSRPGGRWADGHRYVMAFENHGAEVGATLAHPHGQLYALPFVPPAVVTKVVAHDSYRRRHGACLSCAFAADDDERTVVANDSFAVAVPFAARWPYEVHVRARRHGCRRLGDMTDVEAFDLARIVREATARFDGLFGRPLPYLLCVQEAPDGSDDWHLHVELLPPHRDADRLKVRASVETALGLFLNDTVAEHSAARLRAVRLPDVSWAGVTVPHVVPATAT